MTIWDMILSVEEDSVKEYRKKKMKKSLISQKSDLNNKTILYL